MPRNPRNSAAESTDFCRGFYGFLPRILLNSAADFTETCHRISRFDFCWSLIPRKVAAFESGIFLHPKVYKWFFFLHPKVYKKINFVHSIKNGGRGGDLVFKAPGIIWGGGRERFWEICSILCRKSLWKWPNGRKNLTKIWKNNTLELNLSLDWNNPLTHFA